MQNTYRFKLLAPGDPAPWFEAKVGDNPRYHFHTAAGCYLVLGFAGRLGDDRGRAAMATIEASRSLFDDTSFRFFGFTSDPADEAAGLVRNQLPGLRFAVDISGAVARLYGALPLDSKKTTETPYRRQWIVLDPQLRVTAVIPMRDDQADGKELVAHLKSLPPVATFNGSAPHAPVLVLPNLLEREICQQLISLCDRGATKSGFMRDVNGKTTLVHDASHKGRSDCIISDEKLIETLKDRVRRRVVPEIHKAHQFKATRMERYIVGCYDAETSDHFAAHRDNTTKGTAHRRFALSLLLNDEYEGGELNFPEFGPRLYKPAAGAGVVFSCSLLHRVLPVRQGKRYAFLPFLYDDAAAKLREANMPFVHESLGGYKA